MPTSELLKTVFCYGDSNTFGHDPRSYVGDRYPDDLRWTGRLRAYGWEAYNCGLNGRQIPTGEAETQAALAQITSHLPADVVIVMLGSNDLLWNPTFRAEDSAARMEDFLRALLPHIGEAKLLLISPVTMQQGFWVEEERLITESQRLGPLYADIAQRLGIGFCDAAKWDIALGADGLHLTEDGHRVFADCLGPVLTALF